MVISKRRFQSWNVASGKYLGSNVHFSTPLGQPKFHEFLNFWSVFLLLFSRASQNTRLWSFISRWPIQRFETDYSWDILMGNKLLSGYFFQNFHQWRSKCLSRNLVKVCLVPHTVCCKKVLVLWSSWLVTCYLEPTTELQQGYWLRFDIQFSIFWKFSAHLTLANQTSNSAKIFTGTILPGFSNKVRYISMHSQEDQFYLKWFVTWTKKMQHFLFYIFNAIIIGISYYNTVAGNIGPCSLKLVLTKLWPIGCIHYSLTSCLNELY